MEKVGHDWAFRAITAELAWISDRANYHDPVSTLNALCSPGRLLAFTLAFLAAAGCSSPASTTPSASAAGQSTHVSAGERHAVLAFNGTYRVESVVTATTGSYAESVGTVHFYTWQAVPDCGGRSCVVKVTSSTGSHTVFTYDNGEFRGIGSGTVTCFDPSTGMPNGAFEPSILHDTLVPATTSSPVTSLTGAVHLTASGACSDGTGTFRYTLTRTGSTPTEAI